MNYINMMLIMRGRILLTLNIILSLNLIWTKMKHDHLQPRKMLHACTSIVEIDACSFLATIIVQHLRKR